MPIDVITQLETLLEQAFLFAPKVIAALVIFVASLVLASLVRRATRNSLHSREVDPELARVLSRIARWAVIALGIVASLDQVDFDVTSFLAGLGIMGVTLGFALQDIAKNFVAGILLLIQQPFDIGDAINVSGYEGTVVDVTVTYTTIKTFDGLKVSVPNAQVYTNPVTNLSDLPYRRRKFRMRLASPHDPAAASDAFLSAIRAVDGVAEDPMPFININGVVAGQYDMEFFFYVDQTQFDLTGVHSAVVRTVRTTAQEDGYTVF